MKVKHLSLLGLGSLAIAATAFLSGCVMDGSDSSSSYSTHSRDVYYKKHGREKVVHHTNCVDGDCSTTTKKVKHKKSGKTVVTKKHCDADGNCYKTKHHHWS
jgi:hypothetical protein